MSINLTQFLDLFHTLSPHFKIIHHLSGLFLAIEKGKKSSQNAGQSLRYVLQPTYEKFRNKLQKLTLIYH
jgi:hypothetical protein